MLNPEAVPVTPKQSLFIIMIIVSPFNNYAARLAQAGMDTLGLGYKIIMVAMPLLGPHCACTCTSGLQGRQHVVGLDTKIRAFDLTKQ